MLHDSQTLYEELFEAVPSGLLVINEAGLVAYMNRRAELMFGCSRRELVGKPHGLVSTWYSLDVEAVLQSAKSTQPIELALRQEEGEGIIVEALAGKVPGDTGLVVIALRDVTERKREEEFLRSHARQQARVAELGRRALTSINLDQLIDEVVAALTTDLGVEYGNMLELLSNGQVRVRAVIGWPDDVVDRLEAELRVGTPAGEVIQDQRPIVIDDLRYDNRYLDWTVAREHSVVSSLTVPVYGPARPLGVLAIHTTQRRHFTESEVHFVQAMANLIALVMERYQQEERLRERQMVRAEQMAALGQVAAGVAHEIRNPLTSIKGLVQVNLREADARGLPAEDLQVIEQEVRRMERTLQTFLDFARPPRPDCRLLDLAVLVDRVYALVGGRAKKQRVALQFDRPERETAIIGDQDQLQQLLLNLVLNALDAMPEGGMVETELRAPRDGFVELFIRDSGPGIAADILPNVFETFVSSKETGIGIGLPVSRRVAEDHGGSLSAYNMPAGGACFTLRLPAPA